MGKPAKPTTAKGPHPTPGVLHDYFCQLLPPARDSAVAAHLVQCKDCARKAREVKAVLALLKGPRPPGSLRNNGGSPQGRAARLPAQRSGKTKLKASS